MIKNLTPQLAERGKIKIGMKGEKKQSNLGNTFAQPRKLDHFLITTLQRDQAGNFLPDTDLNNKFNKNGGKLTEIPIRLLYDDIELNFMTRYACYKGAKCWCSGDGEIAQQDDGKGKYKAVACPCERTDPLYGGQDKCKILGTLQVLIADTNRIGGVWKFRTTSWNSVNAILSSLTLIKALTGGPLAGIPLMMVLSPKTVTVPSTGQAMVAYVVSLEYWGSETKLAELGYTIAKQRIEHRVKMEQIEEQARRMLAPPQAESIEDQLETAAEFFPDTVTPEALTTVSELVARQVAAQGEDDFLTQAPPPQTIEAIPVTDPEALNLAPPKTAEAVPAALVRQIEHQAKLKGVKVPEYTTGDEAKAVLKALMAREPGQEPGKDDFPF